MIGGKLVSHGKAHEKITILGEYSVSYHASAIVTPFSGEVRCELRQSERRLGLRSSAAISVAITRAFYDY